MRVFLLVFMLLPTFLPFPRQASTNPAGSPTKVNQQPTEKQKVASPAPVKNPIPGESDQNEAKAPAREREPRRIIVESVPKIEKDIWDKVYICLTGVLVVIGGFTLAAILYQAVKTRDATEAIKDQTKAVQDSITLQKTLKRQWLNLEDWRILGEKTQTGERTLISLSFKVVNPTDMELKLRGIELLLLGENQYLTPNLPLAPTKSYSAIFHIKLSKHETENYFRNSVKLRFFGILHFKDNFGDKIDPMFGEYCDGGVDGFEFRAFDDWMSDEEDEDQG